jgi:hypothetical protein
LAYSQNLRISGNGSFYPARKRGPSNRSSGASEGIWLEAFKAISRRYEISQRPGSTGRPGSGNTIMTTHIALDAPTPPRLRRGGFRTVTIETCLSANQPAPPASADPCGPEEADEVIAIGGLPIPAMESPTPVMEASIPVMEASIPAMESPTPAMEFPDLDEEGDPGDPLRPARGILLGAAMGLVLWAGLLAVILT